MQKDELTMTPQKVNFFLTLKLSAISFTNNLAEKPLVVKLAQIYSWLLEKNVTPLQVVHLFYAQLLGVLALLPMAYSPVWRLCFLFVFCWLIGQIFKTNN